MKRNKKKERKKEKEKKKRIVANEFRFSACGEDSKCAPDLPCRMLAESVLTPRCKQRLALTFQ